MAWSIPFVGRLRPIEYLAVLLSFIIVALEAVARVITLALPSPIFDIFYRSSRRLFDYLSSPPSRRSRNTKKKIVSQIAEASDFVELCELAGYYAEEHIVQTRDGYLLGIHRLGSRKNETEKFETINGSDGSGRRKKVVYLHHGLMMNSEIWVCLTEPERCLPFLLVERGYDVWLGNNRGNKYSKKNITMTPNESKFWSFSIDQFAFHDIPDTIDYILSTTGQPNLSYIGFSQGTAQAFAALASHPTLNQKVNLFVALAPAMSPPGMQTGLVETLIKSSPEVLFLLFGRGALLKSATMWQAILYPPIFVRLIDYALRFLFGWHAANIPAHQKLAAYPHLYSFTSTKSVVHWFQIMRNGKFQMYDDEFAAAWKVSDGARFYKVPRFPTRNIKSPITLLYGGSDSLVDPEVMLKELPHHTIAIKIPHFEHLDFLWAQDVDKLVFPHVFRALQKYAGPPDAEGEPTWMDTTVSHSFADSGKDGAGDDADSDEVAWGKHTQSGQQGSVITETSRPEGWWSSDEVGQSTSGPSTPSRSPDVGRQGRRSKIADKSLSDPSGEGTRSRPTSVASTKGNPILIPKSKGISIGKAGSVGGISKSAGMSIRSVSGSQSESGEGKRRKKRWS